MNNVCDRVILEVIKLCPSLLQYVDKQTTEMAYTVVGIKGENIRYVNKDLYTHPLLLDAIKEDPSNIKYIAYPSEDLKYIAVKDDPKCIQYVHASKYVLKMALEKEPSCFVFLDKDEIDYELCKIAIKGNPHMIKIIPEEYQTEELCRMVNTKNRDLLDFVKNVEIRDELKLENERMDDCYGKGGSLWTMFLEQSEDWQRSETSQQTEDDDFITVAKTEEDLTLY